MSIMKDATLVKIGSSNKSEPSASTSTEGQLSRRNFLKILGASSAVGAAGCATDQAQNVLPFVKGDPDQIPGVAVWFRSTCQECSAGCGIQVRTREGRAVKIEGNPEHPVNQGGLCGLGQSALQSLYDPDRVRQPLVREMTAGFDPVFKPISWDDAYARIASALKDGSKRKAFITGEQSGTLQNLTEDWCKAFNTEQVSFDMLQPVALARASELVYGTYGIPNFSFDKAEVLVNFGADFLETWVSPCEYALGWAKGRKAKKRLKVYHVEPRLSLTGANADLWIPNKPGSEARVALAVLKVLLDSDRGANVRDDIKDSMRAAVKGVRIEDVAHESGIPAEKILLMANDLQEAGSSLVIAGGAAAATEDQLPLQVAVAFINLVLANVGKTINLNAMRKPNTSAAKLAALIDAMNKGEIGAVFMHGTNPQFNFPLSNGFRYAIEKVRAGDPDPKNPKMGLIVSFSSSLDESAKLADLILPSHHFLESWGDDQSLPGAYGLVQPVMRPVFDTRSLGDMLLQLSALAGATSVGGGAKDFEGYLKESWKKVHASVGAREDFNSFWLAAVEHGGYFQPVRESGGVKVSVNSEALKIKFDDATFATPKVGHDAVVLMPYPSVKAFDGRAANRPWMQELPDPITRAVWDSWAEVHPKTASQFDLMDGDVVTIRNMNGEINVPVYLTEYVHPGVVAVPLGQGHQGFGRFAKTVGAGNVVDLLPQVNANSTGNVALLSTKVDLIRGRGRGNLVTTQGSDSQHGRELARTSFAAATTAAAAHDSHEAHGDAHHGAHAGHAEPKQMYEQREHPLYRWGMAIDLDACTGCGACVVACYAENNIAVVGKAACSYGREMSWLRIDRYYEGQAEELQVSFQPMLCQHCNSAPCEPVCPVYATYHNEEGLNAMIYNRCVGTRYCSNNCPYKVRRFNFFEYDVPEPLNWQLNPDVTKRGMGIMEKCTFCVQRINEAKDHAKDEGRLVRDGDVQPACVQGCPTKALTFGNLNDKDSEVSKRAASSRAYKVLDHHINTQPAINYLERVKYRI
ncbi:MAG: molybdopterin-dependent oxidoreductase [Deltaproteobacteria bacterium]|nr:molybdopterin-dependent oxidoreductase [Deltaproteobacteria bacterium]